jgi:quercetin dioxygenase-like cupin family protein
VIAPGIRNAFPRGRRGLVALGLVLAFGGGLAAERGFGQASPRMRVEVLLDRTTDQLPRPARVQARLDHWTPGAETGPHAHPGPVVFVMLEGALEEVFPDGRTRTLTAGQAFWKPPREAHNVRNRSGRPARALAVHLDPAP